MFFTQIFLAHNGQFLNDLTANYNVTVCVCKNDVSMMMNRILIVETCFGIQISVVVLVLLVFCIQFFFFQENIYERFGYDEYSMNAVLLL